MVGVNRPLLYEEVVAELCKLIDHEKLMPGNQFPSERELVERWDISRNVLREAFHVLEDRGVIVSKQGKGRFLRALPQDYRHRDKNLSKNLERYSLLEIYETRQVLEVKVVEQIIKNAGDADIEGISASYQKLAGKFRKLNSTVGEVELHRIYANKCKNNFLEHIVNLAFRTSLDMMYNTFRDVWVVNPVEETIQDHGEIVAAIRARDSEQASAAMKRHIQHTIDRLA
jgi:Transcriptional regulators